jgi:predicted RNA binding protein with dsRBD fold (UPF0201 family)
MSVHLDLERLRFALSRNQVSNLQIQYICDEAEGEINEALLSIVSSAVSEALDHAIEIGADAFVDDIQVLPDANGFYQISTHSGNMNYSKESKEMLLHLLKNAKTSQDGHRYKVIPLSQKDTKVEQSMFSVLQARQDAMDDARAALREQAKNRRMGITEALRINVSKQATAAHTVRSSSHAKSGHVEFRTASDRQDPMKDWIIPAKEADMGDYIQDLNRKIVDQARESIKALIDSYYSSYVEG